jgi:hypothetical protein
MGDGKKMAETAGPGDLVSVYPRLPIGYMVSPGGLAILLTWSWLMRAVDEGFLFGILLAITFGLFCLIIIISPLEPHRVHENGLVIHRSVWDDEFYPWSMFDHYLVWTDEDEREGHQTKFELVLCEERTFTVGHPMTDYQTAHRIIWKNLMWRPRPRWARNLI